MEKKTGRGDLLVLESKDLLVRPFKMTDLDDFYEYARQAQVGPPAGWRPHTDKAFTEKILKSFIAEKEVYAIVLKEKNKVIGSIGLHFQPIPRLITAICSSQNYRAIGYVLNSDYWGRGYMTQALSAIIYYSMQNLRLDFLAVSHNQSNLASKRVIEKCGFQFLGQYQKEMVFLDHELVTACAYILKFDKSWKPTINHPYDEITIF